MSRTSASGEPTHRGLIAIVDDDDSVRNALAGLLRSVGLPHQAFASGAALLDSPHLAEVGCLIVDQCMPGMSGVELLAALQQRRLRIPAVFVSAHDDPTTRQRAQSAGCIAFLSKPFDDQNLLDVVHHAQQHPPTRP